MRTTPFQVPCWAAALALLALCAGPGRSEEPAYEIEAEPVFDYLPSGQAFPACHGAVAGRPFPLRVRLRAREAVQGELRARLEGNPGTVTVQPVRAGRGRFVFEMLVQVRGGDSSIALVLDGRLNDDPVEPVRLEVEVYQPSDGYEREGVPACVLWLNRRGKAPPGLGRSAFRAVMAGCRPEDLPSDWRSYTAVDAVILGDVDWDAFPPERLGPLWAWLQAGGRLVVHGSARLPDRGPARGAFGFLREPPGPARSLHVSQWPVGLRDALARAPEGGEEPVPLPRSLPWRVFLTEDGAVGEGGGAALASFPCGLGSVVLCAPDLEAAMLQEPARREVLSRLVLSAASGRPCCEVTDPDDEYVDYRFGDEWTGPSWARHLSERAEVKSLPFLAVAVFAALYILLVGPGDYALVRLLGRPKLTWGTTLVIIALFSLAGHFGMRAIRGTASVLYLVEVRDCGDRGLDRRTYFGAFFPSASRSYRLSVGDRGVLFAPGLFPPPDAAAFAPDGTAQTFHLPVWAGVGVTGFELAASRQDGTRTLAFEDGRPVLRGEADDADVQAAVLLHGGLLYRGRPGPGGLRFDRGVPHGALSRPNLGLEHLEEGFLLSLLPPVEGEEEARRPHAGDFLPRGYLPRRAAVRGGAVLLLVRQGEGGPMLDEEGVRRRHVVMERHLLALEEAR